MGDRSNFGFRQSHNGPVLNLYGHWTGAYQRELMAFAIDRSRNRWSDTTYATRIAISTIIGDDWSAETGYGLMVDELSDNEYPYLVMDMVTRKVIEYPTDYRHTGKQGFESAMAMEPSNTWTFDEFVENFKPSIPS